MLVRKFGSTASGIDAPGLGKPSANVASPGHLTGRKKTTPHELRDATNGGSFMFAFEVVFIGKNVMP